MPKWCWTQAGQVTFGLANPFAAMELWGRGCQRKRLPVAAGGCKVVAELRAGAKLCGGGCQVRG